MQVTVAALIVVGVFVVALLAALIKEYGAAVTLGVLTASVLVVLAVVQLATAHSPPL